MADFYFVGFSTLDTDTTNRNKFFDLELIERDLMTAFQTRVGERVMRPTYGCRLWDWIMEPMTQELNQRIRDEVQRICQSDARVSYQSMNVFDLVYGFRIEVELYYEKLDIVSTFTQNFEDRQNTFTGGS